MKSSLLNIFDNVINQDLCTGCGACVYQAQSADLSMDWNEKGFLVPTRKSDTVQIPASVIQVCPFNPYPAGDVRTEDELGSLFLQKAPNFHPKVGRYYATYAGYSEKFRLTSSSGGLATYVLNELMERRLVDGVITVGEGTARHYEYRLIKSTDELLSTSKTKYYPVTMAEVLKKIKAFDGKVAVVGIGCFIKAIRLLQHHHPELREKITFIAGIICGGMKSKFFADYLAQKAGLKSDEYKQPQFRVKDYSSAASDYSFGCFCRTGGYREIKMSAVGDLWGTAMFKNKACDFCDDVTTELADISLGDVWLKPFESDGRGTNVVVTRSALAEVLVTEGIMKKELSVDALEFSTFLLSQGGGFNHRHSALKYRIDQSRKASMVIPPKRHDHAQISLDFKLVQKQRMKVRAFSLKEWVKYPDHNKFDARMGKELKLLKFYTKLYHYRKGIVRRLRPTRRNEP